jgi:uncharacterized protein YfaS (alpha-2-macroglobulin family)
MKFDRRTLVGLISVLIAVSMLLPAWPLTAAPALAQSAPEPLAPTVLQVMPAPGEEQPLDAPLQVTFDQPMDPQSVQAALEIEPAVAGDLEWPMPHIVKFVPQQPWERATRYVVTLKDEAKSKDGLSLREPVTFRFDTVGYLEVTAVQPAADTTEVAADAVITVLFNRPVVPLTALEDQGQLPQPLTFVPQVTGKGEWLNTSIYTFAPDSGFAPATTYKARVANLTDLTGGVLEQDYTWEFTTVMPAVVTSNPKPDGTYVSTEPTIHVAFNQPMNRAAVEAAFKLQLVDTLQDVTGRFEWKSQGMPRPSEYDDAYEPYQMAEGSPGADLVGAETMIFTPDLPLEFGTLYRAVVPAGTKGAKGGVGTAEDYRWTFTTIEYPSVVSSYPADGEEAADPWGGLQVTFSSPMNPDSINGNFTISPSITATDVYTYWWDNNTELQLSFNLKPSTDYRVMLGRNIEGRDGHKLGKSTVIRWRTRAADPMVYLYAPYRVGTFLSYTPTVAYVNVRNVNRVDFSLYRMPLEDFLQANGEDSWSYWNEYSPTRKNLVRAWSLKVKPELNSSLIYGTNLAGKEGARLDPGIYYLQVEAPSHAVYPEAEGYGWLNPQRQILVVSGVNLSLKTTTTEDLVWATDLKTGQVMPDLPIRVVDQQGRSLARGRTDQDGVFVSNRHRAIDPYQPVCALAGDPDNPGEDFAVAINQWNDGISPWEFDVPVDRYSQPVAGYFFTDRAIYRPGQKVYFKGILRDDDDAHYSVPGGNTDIKLTIYDPQGAVVQQETKSVSDMGTLDGEFQLGEEAALGSYSVEAIYKEQYLNTSFQVAEYRKPEFQVDVQTDKPEYVQGDEINATALATYYFGGPVANAQVRWSVLAADRSFPYQGKGWWDFTDYDQSRAGEYDGSYGEVIAEGTGTTDKDGRFTFSMEADIAEYTMSQMLTLEATVTDINDQEVSNRTEAVVHKGTFYVGLRPQDYVGQANKENAVNIITVDWESNPSPKRDLTVVFSEHNWYSVRKLGEDGSYYWESSVEDVPVYTTTVTSDVEGAATVKFTPETGGIYRIYASGQDETNNQVSSATYMWVSGSKFINWRQENNDRIDLVTDQKQYKVGDTATILIPHPYQGEVQALITVERGHIYQHWVQTLETNSEQIQIPITVDMIPDVFVSVVIVKGQDENNPLPSFKIGYAQLSIDTTEKEISITMQPDKPADQHYQPGETVTYDITATNSEGQPVQAELALSLVDLSVLSLADQPADILSTFWHERGLGVQNATGLTLSVDRINLAVAPEAKGGGGGGEGFGVVRRRFPDTAYWNAVVRTDRAGKATVSLSLPDNLTTWRMSAWGVTADTLVGQSSVDVVSTKDLLVRAVAPRFFVVGDKVELGAVVNNNTDRPLDVEVGVEAIGLQFGDAARQQVSVPARDKARVSWSATAQDAGDVTLRFGARAGSLTDALEIPLPVYRYSTPEVVATAGQLDQDGQRLEGAALPASYDPTQGELTVQIDPSLAAGMVDGLKYLEHYPYECTEQTVSRFLPNVVTYRAYKELGLERPDLETTLPGLVGVGLQRLYNQQHYDGGWGWWSLDDSDPFLTAYVLLGMIEARRAGFVVDENVTDRAASFLESTLEPVKLGRDYWRANRQAFVIYALAEAERGDLGRAVALFERRDMLDIFGKAYLAMALGLLQPDEDTRVKTLLSDITSAAIVSATGAHWEETDVDYYSMNTDTRSTSIVLAALSRLDKENALGPNTVRWLMSVRREGIWETTQENAWAIIALTDWMKATGELEGAYDWKVLVNDQSLGEGTVSRANVDETTKLQIEVAKLLADEVNRIVIERMPPESQAEGSGRLYYSMYLRYFKPVEEVKALSRGIIVSRQYTLSDCDEATENCRAIDQAKVGDVIRVKLTLIAPNDLHHVVVEDAFPAGAEGVDQSLKTTSVVGQAPEIRRTDRRNPWGGNYGWWWFSHTEMRDEKAVLFATYLPRGTYEYTYLIRASLPGEYRMMPTLAYEMYFPEVFGRSDGGLFTVTE